MWLKRVLGKKRLTLTTEEFLKLVVSAGLGVPWDESGAAWEWAPLLQGESARRCSPELRERIVQEQPYLQMFVAVLAAEDTMQESGQDRASFRTALNQMLRLTMDGVGLDYDHCQDRIGTYTEALHHQMDRINNDPQLPKNPFLGVGWAMCEQVLRIEPGDLCTYVTLLATHSYSGIRELYSSTDVIQSGG